MTISFHLFSPLFRYVHILLVLFWFVFFCSINYSFTSGFIRSYLTNILTFLSYLCPYVPLLCWALRFLRRSKRSRVESSKKKKKSQVNVCPPLAWKIKERRFQDFRQVGCRCDCARSHNATEFLCWRYGALLYLSRMISQWIWIQKMTRLESASLSEYVWIGNIFEVQHHCAGSIKTHCSKWVNNRKQQSQ